MNFRYDDRFPKVLREALAKIDFIAIPNLGMLIAGLAVLGFIGTHMLGAPIERFTFDPELVRQGDWWRLFAYPTIGDSASSPIWLLFFVLYVYFVMDALEQNWGSSPLTVFTLLCYSAAIGASFVANRPLSIWVQVLKNISLAFGTVFPEVTFFLFFVVPVKAKWLSLLAGVLMLLEFFFGGWNTKIFLAIAVSPYLLFFGPYLFKVARSKLRPKRRL